MHDSHIYYIYIYEYTLHIHRCCIWTHKIAWMDAVRVRVTFLFHLCMASYIRHVEYYYVCLYAKCKMSFRLLKYIAYLHIGTRPFDISRTQTSPSMVDGSIDCCLCETSAAAAAATVCRLICRRMLYYARSDGCFGAHFKRCENVYMRCEKGRPTYSLAAMLPLHGCIVEAGEPFSTCAQRGRATMSFSAQHDSP